MPIFKSLISEVYSGKKERKKNVFSTEIIITDFSFTPFICFKPAYEGLHPDVKRDACSFQVIVLLLKPKPGVPNRKYLCPTLLFIFTEI